MKKENNYKNPNVEIATKFIQENYTPIGTDPEHISSADIVRELSEMATVTIEQVTNLMDSAGFQIKFIDNRPYWEVYRKSGK